MPKSITPFINNPSTIHQHHHHPLVSLISQFLMGFNVPAQGTTIPSTPHPRQNHPTLQPFRSIQRPDSSGNSFLPELDHILFSHHEQQFAKYRDQALVCTSPIQQHTPSSVPISTTHENPASFVDAWLSRMNQDLSHIPVLRSEATQNRDDSASIPQHNYETSHQELSDISTLQTEILTNQANISSISHNLNDANVGAYIPPHHLSHGNVNVNCARPSKFPNPLNPLRGAQIRERKFSMSLKSNDKLIPVSSMTGQYQIWLQAPQQGQFPQNQQNQCIQEQVPRSAQLSPAVPTTTTLSQPRLIRDGAIKKPRHRRGSRNLNKVQCDKCPELFESKVNALRHMRGCHPKKKKAYGCMHCSASYDGPGARKLHMTKAHPEFMPPIPSLRPIIKEVNGELRYFCWVPDCTNHYNVQNNVKRHYEMHHLKIRYPCKCGHKATTKSNLKAHQTICRIHQALHEREDWNLEEP